MTATALVTCPPPPCELAARPRLLSPFHCPLLLPSPSYQVVQRDRNSTGDLFNALDQLLKREQVKFSQVFQAFDNDNSGTLEIDELRQMVHQLLPSVSEQELRYFQVGGGVGCQRVEECGEGGMGVPGTSMLCQQLLEGAHKVCLRLWIGQLSWGKFVGMHMVSTCTGEDSCSHDKEGAAGIWPEAWSVGSSPLLLRSDLPAATCFPLGGRHNA